MAGEEVEKVRQRRETCQWRLCWWAGYKWGPLHCNPPVEAGGALWNGVRCAPRIFTRVREAGAIPTPFFHRLRAISKTFTSSLRLFPCAAEQVSMVPDKACRRWGKETLCWWESQLQMNSGGPGGDRMGNYQHRLHEQHLYHRTASQRSWELSMRKCVYLDSAPTTSAWSMKKSPINFRGGNCSGCSC